MSELSVATILDQIWKALRGDGPMPDFVLTYAALGAVLWGFVLFKGFLQEGLRVATGEHSELTKLESLAKWASPEALTQLKQAINLPKRSDLLVRNAQGMAEIESLVITGTQPLVRVQVYFQSKALAQTDDILDQGRWLAVLLIKPVKRSQRNPHGLIVMEYRQSQFAATKPEEP